MDRFLIKAAFGSEALTRGWRGAYLRSDAYKGKVVRPRMLSIVSKNQNKPHKCCI